MQNFAQVSKKPMHPVLSRIFGFFLVTTLLSFLVAFVMYKNVIEGKWTMYKQAEGYRAGQYQVTRLEFDYFSKKRGFGGRTVLQGKTVCSHGIIENHLEKFCLNGFLPHAPSSLEDLRQMIPEGSRLNVLYNSEIEETNIAGQSIRVAKFSPTFVQGLKTNLLKNCYYYICPFILSFCLFLSTLLIAVFTSKRQSKV